MLSIGIVGLPNVGKSTLFNALTKSSVLAANYPFATIDPNIGIVAVPDSRLNKLAAIYKTDNIVPATVKFVDIAGLVRGASQGEGLGNQFLSHIRTTSAIIEVVRAFNDTLVTHVDGDYEPLRDIDTVTTELILADLATVTKRSTILEKEARANPKLKPLSDLVLQARSILDSGKPLNSSFNDSELSELKDLQLLTAKPIIYAFNIGEQDLNDQAKMEELTSIVAPTKAVFITAKLEGELTSLDDQEASELRIGFGLRQSSLELIVTSAYETLGLQSFLTAGPKEVRAWTIPKGATAPQAAGVIHGDFERGFIAAEVVDYNDLVQLGSITACKTAGKVRTEGKTYIMQPDDVVEFRFNI